MKKSNKSATHKNNRYILICIALLCVSIFIIKSSFNFSSKEQFGYNVSKTADYKVEVKENNFFKNENMEKNQTYISSVVDNILVDFSYQFKGTNKRDIEYSYNIVSTIDINYTNTSEKLWSQQEILVENKDLKLENGEQFSINENVTIDYNGYNKIAKQFKANFNVPIDATLEIKLTVTPKIIAEDITPLSTISLRMKLNEDTFKIEQKTTGTDNYSLLNDTKQVNKFLLTVGIIMFIVPMGILIKAIAKALGLTNTRSEYSKAISKILKNYGDVVAEIVKPVELTENMQIIDVRNFDQLLDVEEELRMPILFYEVEKGVEGCFIIINNNIAYRYILRNKKH